MVLNAHEIWYCLQISLIQNRSNSTTLLTTGDLRLVISQLMLQAIGLIVLKHTKEACMGSSFTSHIHLSPSPFTSYTQALCTGPWTSQSVATLGGPRRRRRSGDSSASVALPEQLWTTTVAPSAQWWRKKTVHSHHDGRACLAARVCLAHADDQRLGVRLIRMRPAVPCTSLVSPKPRTEHKIRNRRN